MLGLDAHAPLPQNSFLGLQRWAKVHFISMDSVSYLCIFVLFILLVTMLQSMCLQNMVVNM